MKHPDLFDWVRPSIQPLRFNGPAYAAKHDQKRLTGQILRIFSLMQDARWRTLAEIEESTGDPPASVSAQLRHLRKERFGSHAVDKRPRGNRASGLWEYRVRVAMKCQHAGGLGAPSDGTSRQTHHLPTTVSVVQAGDPAPHSDGSA